MELAQALLEDLRAHAEVLRDRDDVLRTLGEELVERWIEEPDRDREPVHRAEDLLELLSLEREHERERASPRTIVVGEDHLAHRLERFRLEEHVLGAAQSDARRAEASRALRVGTGVRVRAHLQPRALVGPLEELGHRARVRGRRERRDLPLHHLAGAAVDRDPVAAPYDGVARVEELPPVVDR